MNRKMWTIFLLGLTATVLLARYALTQGCTPGYSNGSITVGDLQSMCVEQYPAPQTRTDVGIGEDVTISISSWSGTAIFTDQYCHQTQVNDGPGMITWSVSGPGSVYPTSGDGQTFTTLTMDFADADSVVTVTADCTDEYAVAALVQKQKAFNERIPTGKTCYYDTDVPIGILGPPHNGIGGRTDFAFQVLPANVNFNSGKFRENIPLNTWIWEDGTDDSFGPKIFTYTVANNTADNPPTLNWNIDKSQLGWHPIDRLAGVSETVYWDLPQEYQLQNGEWKQFLAEIHQFALNGTTGKCLITEKCTNSSTGTAQGPWQ